MYFVLRLSAGELLGKLEVERALAARHLDHRNATIADDVHIGGTIN